MANIGLTDKRTSDRTKFTLPDNYIYLFHTDEYFIIPVYPETLTDSLTSTFSQTEILARTAPIFSYSHSGPRSMQITLKLHRDLMNDFNKGVSNVQFNNGGNIVYNIDDDYIDVLIKKLQSIALPVYSSSKKKVQPPMIAIRFGTEVFIKGIVMNGVNVAYSLPLLSNNKYAQVEISFTVYETEPYDAISVGNLGSFRGLTSGLRTKMGM